MTNDEFAQNPPSIEEIRKRGLKLLAVIINRTDSEKAIKVLRDKHLILQFTCLAKGTSGSEILDIFGLDSIDKNVIFCVSHGIFMKSILENITEKLHLKKAGKGIAFTVPINGIGVPKLPSGREISSKLPYLIQKHMEEMESEVEKMGLEISHSVILAVVNEGTSDDLMKVAKTAGARGGTVISVKHTGTEEAVQFFGIPVLAEKEIVAILVDKKTKWDIMNSINESFGPKTKEQGFVLSLPVDGIAGIEI